MRALIGVEDRDLWFALSNTGITRWEFRQEGQDLVKMERSIDYSNRVDFLPKTLVTP
jgi:hypothetical protein